MVTIIPSNFTEHVGVFPGAPVLLHGCLYGGVSSREIVSSHVILVKDMTDLSFHEKTKRLWTVELVERSQCFFHLLHCTDGNGDRMKLLDSGVRYRTSAYEIGVSVSLGQQSENLMNRLNRYLSDHRVYTTLARCMSDTSEVVQPITHISRETDGLDWEGDLRSAEAHLCIGHREKQSAYLHLR